MSLNLYRILGSRLLAAVLTIGCALGTATHLPAAAQAQGASPASAASQAQEQRNVYIAAPQARPSGPVRGDFVAAGGRVIVDHPLGGDAALAGGAVDVRAAVGQDLRVIGGDINIESAVGGELLATGGNITIARSATVAGNADVFGGNVVVDGRIDGPLNARAQKVTINGEVRGDARVEAGSIELGPQARIGGALTYASGSELTRAEGATIAGPVARTEASAMGAQGRRGHAGDWDDDRWGASSASSWAGAVFMYLSLLACAAVLLLLAPTFVTQTSDRIKATPWLALAIGLGTVVAVPVLAVLLFVTILGIPLGIIVMALYPALLLAGFVVGVFFVARLLPAAIGRPAPATKSRNLGYVALALILVGLIASVPVVGGLLAGLVSLAGMGACVLELYGRRQKPSSGPPGGQPQPLLPPQGQMPPEPGRV